MTPTAVMAAAIVVPTVGAVGVVAARRHPGARDAITLVASASLAVLVASLVPAVLRGDEPRLRVLELAAGIELSFRADPLGLLFALLASFLWVATSVYAIGYLRGNAERHQTRFHASVALCLSTVMGVAFAANLLTFFLFFELLTVATYPLVTHKATPEARRAGRRYLAYLLGGGAALLLAVGTIQWATGSNEFVPGGFVAEGMSRSTLAAVVALCAVGFGSKAAVLPLHGWLPAAMVAPTPVSALLHAVAVVKAGVFGVARTVGYVVGPEALGDLGVTALVSAAAALTIVVASVVALFQDHLKRRLAYSTIAHLSYIVLGLTLLSASGWSGGLLHMVNHGVLKITLFFCAGALYVHARRDRVSQLDGIGRRMPFTMGAFALAALGLVGLPPMGGFMSKWTLVLGGAEADRPVAAAVMLIGGLLTASYLFPIVARAFLRPVPRDLSACSASPAAPAGEASAWMVAPLVVTAGLALALGLTDALGLLELIDGSTAAVVGEGS